MIEIDFERLRSLGLTPAMAAAAAALPEADAPDAPALQLARVTEVHRETVRLHDGHADVSARVQPRLSRTLLDEETALAVGDWALWAAEPHGQAWVHARVPPLSHIARRDADGRRHPVVSNVDWALLVMGLDDDFNLRRLERYLALVHGAGITPVVVLSKADVAQRDPALLQQRLAAVRARASASVDVLALNAKEAAAARLLSPYLGAGQTLVLLGSSGAGKSTLTNTLLGAPVQDTGAVREHDSRGKHTTTSRSLHQLPGGACVIDRVPSGFGTGVVRRANFRYAFEVPANVEEGENHGRGADRRAKGTLSGRCRRRKKVLLVPLRPIAEAAVLRRLAQGYRPRASCLYRRGQRHGQSVRLQVDRRPTLLRRHPQHHLSSAGSEPRAPRR